jgi:HEAT repeat protein
MQVLILRTRKTKETQESLSAVAQPQKDEIRISADEQEKAELAAIETALQAHDPKVRMEAVAALGNTANKQAVEPLVSALADEHAEVRGQAADALMVIGDVRAVENLSRSMTGDEDTQVRGRAAEALLRIQDQESLDSSDTALQALQDQDSLVRMSVIDTLGTLGNPQGVKPLAFALKDADPMVRLSAVDALRMIGGQEARALVEQALGDGDVEVGKNAAEALSALEEMEGL